MKSQNADDEELRAVCAGAHDFLTALASCLPQVASSAYSDPCINLGGFDHLDAEDGTTIVKRVSIVVQEALEAKLALTARCGLVALPGVSLTLLRRSRDGLQPSCASNVTMQTAR